MPSATELIKYADEYLRSAEIEDWPNALNGVQIQNSGRVTKIGAAVDASSHTILAAVARHIDFLIVHHGLFWNGLRPISGPLYRVVKVAFDHDITLYGSHLPLDCHPIVGNNACLAASLGIDVTEPFLETKGRPIGVKALCRAPLEQLVTKLEQSLGGPVKTFAHGPAETRVVAIVTGAAGSEVAAVAAEGVDTFITGEAPHWAAVAAAEMEVNLLLGGHYATETFGVKALAAHLAEHFKLPWEFIDSPTGL
ncbi:MAG: Nif3-like dinuclear metal center hexameric protein [Chthoniobacterales bacterium]